MMAVPGKARQSRRLESPVERASRAGGGIRASKVFILTRFYLIFAALGVKPRASTTEIHPLSLLEFKPRALYIRNGARESPRARKAPHSLPQRSWCSGPRERRMLQPTHPPVPEAVGVTGGGGLQRKDFEASPPKNGVSLTLAENTASTAATIPWFPSPPSLLSSPPPSPLLPPSSMQRTAEESQPGGSAHPRDCGTRGAGAGGRGMAGIPVFPGRPWREARGS